MRIPWGAAEPGEATAAAVVRILSDLCEIEEEEAVVLGNVSPVTIQFQTCHPSLCTCCTL